MRLNDYLHLELQHRFIIECTNNLQPVVFFKRPDKSPYTIFGKYKHHRLERGVEDIGPSPEIAYLEFTTGQKEFHYNQLVTNSQYCSFSEKKTKDGGWITRYIQQAFGCNKPHQ